MRRLHGARLATAVLVLMMLAGVAGLAGSCISKQSKEGMSLARVEGVCSTVDWLERGGADSYQLIGQVGSQVTDWHSNEGTSIVIEVLVEEVVGGLAVYHGVPVVVDPRTTVTVEGAASTITELLARLVSDERGAVAVACEVTPEAPLMKALALDIRKPEPGMTRLHGGMPWPGGRPEAWCDEVAGERREYWLDFDEGVATIRGVLVSGESHGGLGFGEIVVPDCVDGCLIYHLIRVLVSPAQLLDQDRGEYRITLDAGMARLAD